MSSAVRQPLARTLSRDVPRGAQEGHPKLHVVCMRSPGPSLPVLSPSALKGPVLLLEGCVSGREDDHIEARARAGQCESGVLKKSAETTFHCAIGSQRVSLFMNQNLRLRKDGVRRTSCTDSCTDTTRAAAQSLGQDCGGRRWQDERQRVGSKVHLHLIVCQARFCVVPHLYPRRTERPALRHPNVRRRGLAP